MIKLKDILKELAGKDTLHVYDFDDTLVKTNTKIILIKADGLHKELSSHEYAVYKPQPGDKFDFSNFDKVIAGSNPIHDNIALIKQSLSKPDVKTTILTARRLAFPIMYHLRKKYGIDAYVIAVGSSNPEHKADWIEDQAVNHGYKNIRFFDDSLPNIIAVEKRMKKHPDVNIELQHVK